VLYALKPLFEIEAEMLMPMNAAIGAHAADVSAEAPLAHAG